MAVAAKTSTKSANLVYPIARSEYAHRREETRQKEAFVESNTAKNFESMMVEDFLVQQDSPTSITPIKKPPTKNGRQSQPRRKTRKGNMLPLSIPTPPKPAEGKYYGMGECMHHVLKIRAGRARGAFVRIITGKTPINGVYYRYVNAARSSVYRAIADFNKGKRFGFKESWNKNGRRPLLKDEDMDDVTKSIMDDPTDKVMRDRINDVLVEAEKKRGGLPIQGKQFNPTNVNNYFAELVNRKNISLVMNSIDNTNARYAAASSTNPWVVHRWLRRLRI